MAAAAIGAAVVLAPKPAAASGAIKVYNRMIKAAEDIGACHTVSEGKMPNGTTFRVEIWTDGRDLYVNRMGHLEIIYKGKFHYGGKDIDYKALGENTITIDCDVLQADGGTRTAAITGAYVALADAVAHLRDAGALAGEPLINSVAAISVGIIDGTPMLDLPYVEDVRAETDMNVVMTGSGKFVEVQGTAEGQPFDKAELDALLALAAKGCADLTRLQQEALGA